MNLHKICFININFLYIESIHISDVKYIVGAYILTHVDFRL